MAKKWTYHVSHEYIEASTGKKFSFISQMYLIGIYGIINNDPAMQGTFTPQKIRRMEKMLKKTEKDGDISDLTFGKEITVTLNNEGYYEEVV